MTTPDSIADETEHDVWPALTDLLAATAMIFLVLLGVVVVRWTDSDFESTRNALVVELKRLSNERNLFEVREDSQFVRVLLLEDVTFPTGKYHLTEIKPEGRRAIGDIAEILSSQRFDSLYRQVLVVGHTDQVPIRDPNFTNWELATMRAAAVVRLMVSYRGMDPCRISASGVGPFFPVRVPEGSSAVRENRRIEIVIVPRVNESKSLFSSEAASGALPNSAEACYPAGDGMLQAQRR